jgi:hypothetical protein
MSGWEQVAGSKENDPIKLAESGEKQQWSFHSRVFDFECHSAPHKYQLIPNGDPARPIQCTEVALQAGDGAELLSDFDVFARINAEAKVRDIFAYAGKMVLAQEELERLANPEAQAEDQKA